MTILKRENSKLLAIAALAFGLGLFASCDSKPQNPKKGVDGYHIETTTFERTNFPVEVVLVKSQEELKAEFKKRSPKSDPRNLAAFAVIRPNDPRCTIYMVDPKVRYEPQYIGHEFVHCMYGDWHPNQ